MRFPLSSLPIPDKEPDSSYRCTAERQHKKERTTHSNSEVLFQPWHRLPGVVMPSPASETLRIGMDADPSKLISFSGLFHMRLLTTNSVLQFTDPQRAQTQHLCTKPEPSVLDTTTTQPLQHSFPALSTTGTWAAPSPKQLQHAELCGRLSQWLISSLATF